MEERKADSPAAEEHMYQTGAAQCRLHSRISDPSLRTYIALSDSGTALEEDAIAVWDLELSLLRTGSAIAQDHDKLLNTLMAHKEYEKKVSSDARRRSRMSIGMTVEETGKEYVTRGDISTTRDVILTTYREPTPHINQITSVRVARITNSRTGMKALCLQMCHTGAVDFQ